MYTIVVFLLYTVKVQRMDGLGLCVKPFDGQASCMGPAGALWPTGIVRLMLSTRCRHCCRSIVTIPAVTFTVQIRLTIKYHRIRCDTINYTVSTKNGP